MPLQEPVAPEQFSGPVAEDSDAWLEDSGAELEAELARAQSAADAGGGGGGPVAAPAAVAQLDQISQRMQVWRQI